MVHLLWRTVQALQPTKHDYTCRCVGLLLFLNLLKRWAQGIKHICATVILYWLSPQSVFWILEYDSVCRFCKGITAQFSWWNAWLDTRRPQTLVPDPTTVRRWELSSTCHLTEPGVLIFYFTTFIKIFSSFYIPTAVLPPSPSPVLLPPLIPLPVHSSEAVKLSLGSQWSLAYQVEAWPPPSPTSHPGEQGIPS